MTLKIKEHSPYTSFTYTTITENPDTVERVHHLTLQLLGISYGSTCFALLPPCTHPLCWLWIWASCPHSFTCGLFGSFHYPFTKAEQPDCGLIPIHDCDHSQSIQKKIQLEENGKYFVLTGITQQDGISISDEDLHKRLQNNICDTLNNSYSLPSHSPLYSCYIKYNVTLFRCKHGLNMKPPPHYFNHSCPEYDYDIYYDSLSFPNNDEAHKLFSSCSVLTLSKKDKPDTRDILSFVSAQMVVQVLLSKDCDDCYNHRGGQCSLDRDQQFYCHEEKSGKKMLVVVTGRTLHTRLSFCLDRP
ncbi:uncharacterized protein LOC114191438 [Vigna unguiculata]|uniref:uncharacterized protein LOC114191438 n=1 Tax=Vigna unguiculata TaxID=3917 RepID=UPI0010161D67|nr:uncharacterized protein LOC114191438 [Vigna unguiculata]